MFTRIKIDHYNKNIVINQKKLTLLLLCRLIAPTNRSDTNVLQHQVNVPEVWRLFSLWHLSQDSHPQQQRPEN